jgi:pimeloyl-ACP methyl ester carboxylesterase
MDAGQFQVLQRSLCSEYSVLSFELPYHKGGVDGHSGWVEEVCIVIESFLIERGAQSFSLAGYSIGSKIALYLFQRFSAQVEEMFLFAPYGIEDHWGLRFVTGTVGNSFFRLILKSALPEMIIRLATQAGVIDQDLQDILMREMAAKEKRLNLCNALKMVGELAINFHLVDMLNESSTHINLIYGKQDVLLPLSSRNVPKLKRCKVIEVPMGHWLMTEKLDEILCQQMIAQ